MARSICHRPILLLLVLLSLGCAKGALWQTGQLTPWGRKQLAEEEKYADTLFVKRRRMDDSVAAAKSSSVEAQEKVADQLGQTIAQDSVLLMRLHAVRLLGELDCPTAIEVLETASRDYNTDIRIAAIEAWKKKPSNVAVAQLQQLVLSDTNVDVRLAATRALGQFPGEQTIRALSLAINDPDPALQLRAADSLRNATGQPFGRDIVAWQEYVQQHVKTAGDLPAQPTQTANQQSSTPAIR
jgi:HEAT repeat protein